MKTQCKSHLNKNAVYISLSGALIFYDNDIKCLSQSNCVPGSFHNIPSRHSRDINISHVTATSLPKHRHRLLLSCWRMFI